MPSQSARTVHATEDAPGSPPGTPAPAAARSGGLLLLGISLGYFMVLLDTTVVTVALPAIGAELSGSLSGLQWVSNGYTLTFAALLLTAGALSDRYGGRKVFVTGLWLFAAFSGASAAIGSLGALIALRALLGVAGALLLPTSLAIIAHAFTEPAVRARALGAWAAISGSALAAGPLVGGVLSDSLGWRAVFLINVPVALLSLVLVVRHAPANVPGAARGLDLPGQATAVLALTALTYGLVESGPEGWGSPRVLGSFALFLLSAPLLVAAERRTPTRRRSPMLPPGLFRDRTLSCGLCAGLLVNFGLSGVLFVLSLSFQETHGHSAFTTGLLFLPLTLPTAFNPVLTGRLVGRIGARGPAITGFLMMGAGVLVQSAASDADSTAALATTCAGLLVMGFGVSFAIPPLMTAVVGSVAREQSGIASGALNSARQTGAVLGVSVLGAVIGSGAPDANGTRYALLTAALSLLAGAGVVAAWLRPGGGPAGK
ncbi:MFS transporter [Streptomyces sp. NPDC007088]|uniref:MFS transporter n=1 Tax=Streptomyces sp. NPDC007088 TaxID=3364773 RepID=UPI0036C6F6E2